MFGCVNEHDDDDDDDKFTAKSFAGFNRRDVDSARCKFRPGVECGCGCRTYTMRVLNADTNANHDPTTIPDPTLILSLTLIINLMLTLTLPIA